MGLLLLVVVAGVGFTMMAPMSGQPDETVAEGSAGTPPPAPMAVAEPASTGPGTTFVSKMNSTRKVTVRCGGDKTGHGATQAFVPGEAIGQCTVTAIGLDRKRFTAVVKGVETREYSCFESGEMACK